MKIAVLGLGNMGLWLARRLSGENQVTAYDVDYSRMKLIEKEQGATPLNNLPELAPFAPDMLINAVSLQHTVEVFRAVENFLPDNCLLVDVASVKGDIPDYYGECKFRHVSVHPMFGPTFANLESLKKENAIIIKDSDPKGMEFFRRLFKNLGLTIFEYTAEEHDQMMAYSLSLPFISSMVFASCMQETAVPGSTFARHREIAHGLLSEDDRLLSEILFNKFTKRELERVTSRLVFLKHIIMGKDYEEAKIFYDKLRENI